MMQKVRPLLLALSVAAFASLASAQQTLWGTGGLLLNPTADLAPAPRSVQLSYLPVRGAGVTTNWFNLAAAARLPHDTEVYGAIELQRSGKHAEGLAFGIKRQFIDRPQQNWEVAGGVDYSGILDRTGAYLVASAHARQVSGYGPNPLRFHAGLRWDRYSGLGSESTVTGFLGIEASLGPGWTLFGEANTKHHDRVNKKTPFAIGLRHHFRDGACLTVAAATPGYAFADKTALALQFSRPIP